jgi:hypothetical protein
MKRQFPTILITIGHATLTCLLFLQSFRMGLSRFDSGAPAMPGERVLNGVVEIMMLPLLTPLQHWRPELLNHLFPGLFGYIPLLLNSMIWAIVIVRLWRKIQGSTTASGHRQ